MVGYFGEVLGLLGELEYTLRSNPKEKITSQEEHVLENLKETFVNTFLVSGSISTLVTWKVAKRFSSPRVAVAPRLLLSVYTGFFGGLWGMTLVESSCLNPILSADGSRMQRELANIMLAKHHVDSSPKSFVSKHLPKLFYPEQVLSDSHSDKPLIKWRMRNFYEESSSALLPQNPPEESIQLIANKKKKRVPDNNMEPSGVATDPLDCIFGYADSGKMMNSSDNIVHSRRLSRAQKKAQRRNQAKEQAQTAEK